ncbi:hypothetical protein STEG23_006267 [Scotinomys teguina]
MTESQTEVQPILARSRPMGQWQAQCESPYLTATSRDTSPVTLTVEPSQVDTNLGEKSKIQNLQVGDHLIISWFTAAITLISVSHDFSQCVCLYVYISLFHKDTGSLGLQFNLVCSF